MLNVQTSGSGKRWAIEARRKERGGKQEQNTGQEPGNHVRFDQEEQQEETEAESTDEPEVTGRLAEMRTGRGSSAFVRGGDERYRADESSRKGKGRGNGGKGEHEGKGGEFGRNGKQHERKTRKDENNGEGHELGRMAPNMGAGGSYPQAISDPEKKEEKKETSEMRWADCEDDERKEEGERKQEKERERERQGKRRGKRR